MRFCTNCIHQRQGRHLRLISPGFGSSPGRIDAATEELRIERERRESEQRRIDEDYAFDYEPGYFAWCARFTPDWKQIGEFKKRLEEGVPYEMVIEQARGAGVGFKIYPATGDVRPVYELCQRVNREGNCTQHVARVQGGQR